MKERIDDLGINNLRLIQNPKYFCFGVDAVLLSDFAKSMGSNKKILEVGTGNGVIPILLSAKVSAKKIHALEVQKELYELATRNVEFNKLENLITIHHQDIKTVRNIFEKQSFDVVLTNPPYKKINSGIVNDNDYVRIAKHETLCTLEDIVANASYLLNDSGKFYMVHRPDRLIDICCILRKYKLEPKRIRFVHSKPNTTPVLILVESMKHSKPFLKYDKPLYIYDENGKYTNEIFEIYGKDVTYE